MDLGKKVGNLDLGGYSPTSDLDSGKKVGQFGFLDWGGVFSNFGSGLRKKSWNFGLGGGYSETVLENRGIL